MRLTIKTLTQDQFSLDVEPTDKVLEVKQKIEKSQGHSASLQKLIFSGKILTDEKPISEYKISEKDFLVLMVSKPKSNSNPSSSGGTTATSPKNASATPTISAPLPAPRPTSSPNTSSITSAPASESIPTTNTSTQAPASPQSTQPQQLWGNASALVTGPELESAIQRLEEMGFERGKVESAMRASFNNPDRAAEYLMTGIPENLEHTSPPVTSSATLNQSAPVPALTPSQNVAGTAPASQPQNLFQAAAQQQQQQQQGGAEDLNFWRNNPQFQQLRQRIQQNPAHLQPFLQQIGQSNPHLMRLINANPQMFVDLLAEGGESTTGEGNIPPPQYVSITQEEKDAIDRLEALGFDRASVIEAFLACDRNEELAANYLFDHMNDES